MVTEGTATRRGVCAICADEIRIGQVVYFDATKIQGKHLAHSRCWEKLLRERGPQERPKGHKPEVRSAETLDPPF